LTKNEMTVRRLYAGAEVLHVTGSGYAPAGELVCNGQSVAAPKGVLELLRAGALCSDATLDGAGDRWHVNGDPTEGALIVVARKAGIDVEVLQRDFERVDEIPFTSERKRMTTLHRTSDGLVALSKGASDMIIATCTRELVDDVEIPLTQLRREQLDRTEQEMTAAGLRVLAIARKRQATQSNAEDDATFLGYVAMMDPPRPEAAEAVRICKIAGITPVMITGDHPLTASVIAREVGILDEQRVVSGRELAQMTDAELARDVQQIRVYARVSPADKLRIVNAWQQHRDSVVAMTGDGINDAPALKKADVGVAMGITGTDVSREASGMTLLDDNFATIVAAVEEGRIVFANIRKFLAYLLSSNAGEILLMAAATLAGLPLPLTAVQILYVNLASDGLPALALAVDPPEKDLMKQQPRSRHDGVFTRPLVVLMIVGGIWSALMNVTLFAWLLHTGHPLKHAMAMTFVSLVLIQFFKAYSFRSDHASIAQKPFANKWLNLAVVWELALLAIVIYTPFLQQPFGTFALTPSDWWVAIAMSATVVPVLEVVKWMIRRGWFAGSTGTHLQPNLNAERA
jgi:Ca2+-transporting ATPase